MLSWPNLLKVILPVAVVAILFAYSSVFSSPLPKTASSPNPKFLVQENQPTVSATAYAVFDIETGEVLVSKKTEEVLPIASVTKLITATALTKNVDLNKEGTITKADTYTEGEAGKLVAGEKYQYRELLFPLLLESSNDAATFFERETKGEIISHMNNLVEEVGMSQTKLVDASGLSDNNQSSVTDLSLFLRYLVANEPYILDITNLEQYVGPYSGYLNNSPVLNDQYRGGKHGYTVSANRTLTAIFEEELSQSKRTIGYVLLGSENLATDIKTLRNFVAEGVTYE